MIQSECPECDNPSTQQIATQQYKGRTIELRACWICLRKHCLQPHDPVVVQSADIADSWEYDRLEPGYTTE